MKEFLRLLAPLRHKLMAERFLKWFIYGETAAGILCLAVVALSKFWTEIPVLPLCGAFSGAAHSSWSSVFPAKSNGKRNGGNSRRLGRRGTNDYHHGAFG